MNSVLAIAAPARSGPAYRLVTTPGGSSIRSLAEGETFHPVAGPEAEAEALYLRQLRLVDQARAETGQPLVIWDVGLGAGGNICTVLRALGGLGVTLRVVSFEHSLAPLECALEHSNRLPHLRGFDAILRVLMAKGETPLEDLGIGGRWELKLGDFPRLVTDRHAHLPPPSAVLYDAYSPAKNPAMWSLPVFQAIRSRVPAGCDARLATFSRATLVRTALLLGGWFVGRGEPVAGKEETTVASTELAELKHPLDQEFLRRAIRSDAAEPLEGRDYRRRWLLRNSADQLRLHPQFAEDSRGSAIP